VTTPTSVGLEIRSAPSDLDPPPCVGGWVRHDGSMAGGTLLTVEIVLVTGVDGVANEEWKEAGNFSVTA
jgi:hypothetical protein